MSDLTNTDLSRLHLRLSDLPGFDPVGLVVYATGNGLMTAGKGWCLLGLCQGEDSDGAVWWSYGLVEGNIVAAWEARDEVCVHTTDSSTRDRVARCVAGCSGLPALRDGAKWS